MPSAHRICLVGAGVIAATHAEALSQLGIKSVALVEPMAARAEKFARRWSIPQTYPDLAAALAAGGFDAVHILTPPGSHFTLARQCIAAGMPVLVEKPITETAAEANQIVAEAEARGVLAAVNQNFIFHPAFAKLRAQIAKGAVGRLRSVVVTYNAPLRQLAARQFGAWMFHRSGNILLEQAVHPLSQVIALLGAVDGITAIAGPAREIAHDLDFHDRIDAVLTAERGSAHLQFTVGAAFPFWQLTAVCDDGILVADMLNNRFFRVARGAGIEPLDAPMQAIKTAAQIAGAGLRGSLDYGLSLAKLQGRSDPFFLSMKGSLKAFYRGLRKEAGSDHVDAKVGAEIVRVCEVMAEQCFAGARVPASAVPPERRDAPADVVLLGGTGFIGAALTRRLAKDGRKVRVMARNVRNLADTFWHPNVSVVSGDIGRAADVRAAVSGTPVVVNLAHGGGGETYAEIERALVGGARTVAEVCTEAGVNQLIHIGSIASLYLGDPAETVTCTTPPDAYADERADYARAKAVADRMLMTWDEGRQMKTCILRPGVVVGEGTSPFHSGLGMFNNEQFCIGWNDGRNALPFVLVDDVAAATAAAIARVGHLGKTYNLVGDVRLTAREYIAALAKTTQRPLHFCPSNVRQLYLEEFGKWLIKRAVGRAAAPPSLRDLRSRGLSAKFDCSAAITDLGWRPVADRDTFIRDAFAGL